MVNAFFLTYEDAVAITHDMVSIFNSEQGQLLKLALAEKFNLGIREGAQLNIDVILRNCPECSGCHHGACTLGCFFGTHESGTVCYWDEALESMVGTKLVTHEVLGHAVYEQIMLDGLDPNSLEHFNKSEKFAQFVEKNVHVDLSFNPSELSPNSNPTVHRMDIFDEIGGSFWGGIGFGLASAAITVGTMVGQRLFSNKV